MWVPEAQTKQSVNDICIYSGADYGFVLGLFNATLTVTQDELCRLRCSKMVNFAGVNIISQPRDNDVLIGGRS